VILGRRIKQTLTADRRNHAATIFYNGKRAKLSVPCEEKSAESLNLSERPRPKRSLPNGPMCRYEEYVLFPGQVSALAKERPRDGPSATPPPPSLKRVFALGSGEPQARTRPGSGTPGCHRSRSFKVLKRMVRPARDHMTAKGRVLGSEIFLSAARRAAFSHAWAILSSVSSTHLRAFLGPISPLYGAALAPLAGAGSTVSVSSSQQYVASLPLPGSSSVSALTRARTRRVPLGPDVRTRVSHGQQNADRCQPPGRNTGGGITR